MQHFLLKGGGLHFLLLDLCSCFMMLQMGLQTFIDTSNLNFADIYGDFESDEANPLCSGENLNTSTFSVSVVND